MLLFSIEKTSLTKQAYFNLKHTWYNLISSYLSGFWLNLSQRSYRAASRWYTLLETDFSLCVSKFPESFSNSTQGNSYFLNGYSKTHREIAVHTRKFIFSCRLPQNSQEKFRTHRKIHIFFVSCEKRTGQLLNTQGNPYFLCRLQ